MSGNNESSTSMKVAQEELRGFSRSMAELEWLILIACLLYLVVPGAAIKDRPALIAVMVAFAAFVVVFRYTNFHLSEARWKLAVETWAMLAFISCTLWYTGDVHSPLINLYLLVIISAALTLGKLVTFMELGLIACWYVYMAYSTYGEDAFSLHTLSDLIAIFSPFVLVAYLTSMLSSDIHHAKRQVVKLSETDELTGLPNMRAFNMMLHKETRRFMRYGRPFSLMMIDVDGLKEVNDRYGHEAGNRLIMMTATHIKSCGRKVDTVARYGGDEFIMLLPETESDYVHQFAERVREAVEKTSCDVQGARLRSTVSIGIACCPADAISPRDLMDKADAALYSSKRAGRNQTTLWRHEEHMMRQASSA